MQVTDQTRPQWLELRKNTIGASEAHDVLTRPLSLYLRKLGMIDEPEPTDAMRWGLIMEPILKAEFERQTGERVVLDQVFEVIPGRPISATADGITLNGDLVEYKCMGEQYACRELGEPGTDEIPERWVCQAYQQLAVHEVDTVHFAVLVGGNDFRLYRVDRDTPAIEALLDKVEAFWHDHIATATPPASDGIDLATLKRVIPQGDSIILPSEVDALISRRNSAREAVKTWQEQVDSLDADILRLLGTAERGETPSGRVLTRRPVHVKEQLRKAYTYYRFSIKEPSEDR